MSFPTSIEIRENCLSEALRLHSGYGKVDADEIVETASKFEVYITNGKTKND